MVPHTEDSNLQLLYGRSPTKEHLQQRETSFALNGTLARFAFAKLLVDVIDAIPDVDTCCSASNALTPHICIVQIVLLERFCLAIRERDHPSAEGSDGAGNELEFIANLFKRRVSLHRLVNARRKGFEDPVHLKTTPNI